MKRKLAMGFLLVTVMLLALAASPVLGGNGNGPADEDDTVRAEPTRGKPVKIDGKDMRLSIFVYPERGGKGKKPPKGDPPDDTPSVYCTDGNQSQAPPRFAQANPNGLTFKINDGSIPINSNAAIGAIHSAFETWDSVVLGSYFTVNNTGGATRPAADGNNSVGWVKIVPRSTLAAAWVWWDPQTGLIDQADVFYNSFHKWAAFTDCDAQGRYEVGNVGTHEFGHVMGLDHISDAGAYATMFPSASKGEVRKQSLTDGDAQGYKDAGGK